MRKAVLGSCFVVLMSSCLASVPAWAQVSKGSVVGFGGLTINGATSRSLFGGGVQLQLGPVLLDAGYRYKRILGNGTLDRVLTGGDNINLNQVRMGVGFRF